MRVATLYDVHGNVRALEAVLDEIPEDASIVVGGDVAAGPFPQEAVDRLRTIVGARVVNSGSVGKAYENEPGAYWTQLGPDVEFRHEPYELDTDDYPGEWPASSRDEAVAFFETRAVGA